MSEEVIFFKDTNVLKTSLRLLVVSTGTGGMLEVQERGLAIPKYVFELPVNEVSYAIAVKILFLTVFKFGFNAI